MATLQDFIDARGGEYPCPQTNACTDATLLYNDDFINASFDGGFSQVLGDNYYWNFASYTSAGSGNGTVEFIADETEHIGIVRMHEADTGEAYSETIMSIWDTDVASTEFQGYGPVTCDEYHFSLRWHSGTGTKQWATGTGKRNLRFGFENSPSTEHSFQYCSTADVQQGFPSTDTVSGAFFRACEDTGNWTAVVVDLFGATEPYATYGESTADTGVAISLDEWQCFRIRIIDDTTIGFKVDDGAEVTIDGFTHANVIVTDGFIDQVYWLLGGSCDGTAYLDVDYGFIINANCEECTPPGTGPGSGGLGLCPQGPDGTGGKGLGVSGSAGSGGSGLGNSAPGGGGGGIC